MNGLFETPLNIQKCWTTKKDPRQNFFGQNLETRGMLKKPDGAPGNSDPKNAMSVSTQYPGARLITQNGGLSCEV